MVMDSWSCTQKLLGKYVAIFLKSAVFFLDIKVPIIHTLHPTHLVWQVLNSRMGNVAGSNGKAASLD